ncbi:long-chain fatty acid--CoA ligase [Pradoshia sp. D12]|uniref:long-chain fatty acid--CoA ligase n=1 Tax=Bacillaceae TaxID=186817 RepID=UPI00112B80BB|nr:MULTISPECIES: long-chain fatty acid--CoA ligase [Bacillaceae]QFK71556.1 long-chain fatty acid--CoA ligase [Pradoshia sp. D12]TPF73351.1 long-chain fatty acid--CoA ligase [Bacillus sp. D12]
MMMHVPLTVHSLLERAEKVFPKKEVVSRTHDKVQRLTYKEIGERTRRLADVLQKMNVSRGDKVGTLAWNHHRHLEAYFAVPGIGAVVHTINIRLSAEHITYIINHAEDKVLLIDEDIVPLIEKIAPALTTVKAYIIMTDQTEIPSTSLKPAYSYEELLAVGNPKTPFINDLDENEIAGMCYTSATTGNPKGVLYSHRGIVLHSFALGLADTTAVSERDVVMPVVPMFHVNAWGLPFAATWFGATQVLPGPQFNPKLLAEFIQSEGVTKTAGVPTIWLGLLQELEKGTYDTSTLEFILCGGSAAPKGLIKQFEIKYKIPFLHAYGMTETAPLATVSRLKSYQLDLPEEELLDIRAKQGLLVPGLEMKVVGSEGEVNWNGLDMGELMLRGNWIADEYYRDERTAEAFKDGWLLTGDIATVDEEGTIKLVDRTKDLIKSGGEWISSVDLENALMAHEAIFEASVVAIPHPEWQERPVGCVVLKPEFDGKVTEEEIQSFLKPQFAKWWIPDEIIFMDEIPKTSVGKFLKAKLREMIQERVSNN